MITAASVVKPPMWSPGRNAHPLWRRCQLYWPLWDIGPANIVSDLSGNSYGGVFSSDATPVIGRRGTEVYFPTDSDCIICNSKVIGAWSALTVFALVRTDASVGDTRSIASNWQSTATQGDFLVRWFGAVGTAGLQCYIRTDATYSGLTNPSSNVADKHQAVAFRWDGAELSGWVDGVKGGTTVSAGGSLATPVNAVHLGTSPHALANELQGSVGVFAMWDRALGANEIAELAADPFCMIRPPAG